MLEECKEIFKHLEKMNISDRVEMINKIREELAKYSPFAHEPVDCVKWVKNEHVGANDYNPNSVAPPEMELLRLSIMSDGYTQPIVTFDSDEKEGLEVVDGFHRNRVGKECEDVKNRVHGYLPVVIIRDDRTDKNDRIAATIRHNRARGKHSIDAMADIVMDLKRRNWSDKKISRELGMDADEVLRLSQITGLAEAFENENFSKSWVADLTQKESEEMHAEDIEAV